MRPLVLFGFVVLVFVLGCTPLGQVGQYAVGPNDPPGVFEVDPTKAVINPSRLTFEAADTQKQVAITVTDNFIYNKVGLCEAPCSSVSDWKQVGLLTGPVAFGNFLDGRQGVSLTVTLPRDKLNSGNNFLAIYSCSGLGLCHNNHWVKVPLTVTFAAPTCSDNVQNGAETDVDCGGSCAACADGKKCVANTDCAGRKCGNNVCQSQPDLVVRDIVFGTVSGNLLPVTIRVQNTGTATATQPISVGYTVTFPDVPIQAQVINTLTITADVPVSATGTSDVAANIPLGEALQVTVGAYVDPTNQKVELDESNNRKEATTTVTLPGPGPVGGTGTVAPNPLQCALRTACATGEISVLQLSATSSAHGALPTGTYPQKVCCKTAEGPVGAGSGEPIIYLSGTTNAHFSATTSTAYATIARMTVPTTKVRCITTTQVCSAADFDTCTISLSGMTNAEGGSCGTYQNNVCCTLLNATNLCFGKIDGFVCDDGKTCTNGQCLTPGGVCVANTDCASGQKCDSITKTCVSLCTGVSCASGQKCDPSTGSCVSLCSGVSCQTGQKCDPGTGNCVQCLTNTDCTGGLKCDTTTKICVNCLVDADCRVAPNAPTAVNVGCGQQTITLSGKTYQVRLPTADCCNGLYHPISFLVNGQTTTALMEGQSAVLSDGAMLILTSSFYNRPGINYGSCWGTNGGYDEYVTIVNPRCDSATKRCSP